MKKVVFMGTPDFAVPILESLIQSPDYEVQAVVTQPDRPAGRKKVLKMPPVKELAVEHNLLVLQPDNMKDEEVFTKLQDLAPDLLITAAFGQFLPVRILDLAPYGVVNVHASLLPKYRGGAPIHAAIINGDKETGVTIMKTVLKMDAGDILSQRVLPITDEDNVGTIFEQLSLLGRDLLLETLPHYFAGQIKPIAQDEQQATISPNISREAEVIDWSKNARAVFNHIRGLNPWPVAHTLFNDTRLKVFNSFVVDESTTLAPGTICKRTKDELWVACGEQTVLALTEVQLAGKSKMSIQQFLNGSGQKLQLGDLLG